MQKAVVAGWAHVSIQLSVGTETGLEFICGIFGELWVSGEGSGWSNLSVLSAGPDSSSSAGASQPSLELLKNVRLRRRRSL